MRGDFFSSTWLEQTVKSYWQKYYVTLAPSYKGLLSCPHHDILLLMMIIVMKANFHFLPQCISVSGQKWQIPPRGVINHNISVTVFWGVDGGWNYSLSTHCLPDPQKSDEYIIVLRVGMARTKVSQSPSATMLQKYTLTPEVYSVQKCVSYSIIKYHHLRLTVIAHIYHKTFVCQVVDELNEI